MSVWADAQGAHSGRGPQYPLAQKRCITRRLPLSPLPKELLRQLSQRCQMRAAVDRGWPLVKSQVVVSKMTAPGSPTQPGLPSLFASLVCRGFPLHVGLYAKAALSLYPRAIRLSRNFTDMLCVPRP